MADHNQLKRISVTPQANTLPYADEDGFITAWLEHDPLITSLKNQNELIGAIATAPEPDTQAILTQFVIDEEGRQPRTGDEVSILDVGELWIYNGTRWVFFAYTTLSNATKDKKGIMQVGDGLSVEDGVVSVDSDEFWETRASLTNASTTPTLAPQKNTDYKFTNALTSLTLTNIPNSPYYTTLSFTTGATFTYSAPTLTEYFGYNNPPVFEPNTKYELTISKGRGYINRIGAAGFNVNKYTYTNPKLTAASKSVTWTIANDLATQDIFLRVYESATGNTVEVESKVTASQIVIRMFTDLTEVAAGTYTLVTLG